LNPEPLLSLEHLNVSYGAIHALHDVSLTVNTGEVVTLIGANGAGKSTTLRAITGLLSPRAGRIVFEGRDLAAIPAHQRVARGISMAPEGRGIFANLTVLENLEMGAYLKKDRTAIQQDIDRGFALFPRLKERIRQPAGTLSGGEQQMLAIARALMLKPRLMLLDEPSFGLAPLIVVEIFRILRRINEEEKVSILLVEQNAALALDLATHAYVLETGRVVMSGPSAVVKNDENVRKSYLGY